MATISYIAYHIEVLTPSDWASPTEFDTRAANNWGTALL